MDDATRSRITRVGETLALSFRRARLVIEEGPDRGRRVALQERPLEIGRGADADLRLGDDTVSRRHAALHPREDGWDVRDLGSKSGTTVDGVLVDAARLRPGSRIRVGGTTLRFEVIDETVEVGDDPEDAAGLHGMLGESPAARELFALARKVGRLDLPVLIRGPSGSGKEGLARALHLESRVAEGPYEVVDCTLLAGDHLRSELFGHVKGAFTGADQAREGAFARADGGTLLLDEVAEIPVELQPTLLRVLEEGEVRPLGGDRARRVRVRVLCATNRDLEAMVSAGEFRADLFYRLSAVTLEIPPLADRPEDVIPLAQSFLPEGRALAPDAVEALRAHGWPGNVRELRNVVERAAGLAEGSEVRAADLLLAPRPAPLPRAEALTPAAEGRGLEQVDAYERELLREALARCGGNKKAAAEELGIARSTLYYKLRKLGLE